MEALRKFDVYSRLALFVLSALIVVLNTTITMTTLIDGWQDVLLLLFGA